MSKKSFSLTQTMFTEQEILQKLQTKPKANYIFSTLPKNLQQELLDFFCGKTGLSICYDVVFKKIFSPFENPHRLEKLLTAILGQKAEIIGIISNDGTCISDRGSFVVMDMVVRLSDQTILNTEIQKSGYKFPGQRFDCYCADLIMREYNRLHKQDNKNFSYQDIPPVLSIAIIENSTSKFRDYPSNYIHKVSMKSDTGIEFTNLTQHIYVALDIFHAFMQNKPITTPLEAWLTLLTTRDLDRIDELVQKDPDFANIYQEVFELRTKPEELIYMFSKVLLEGDRNMERFMIDEFRQEKEQAKREAEAAKQEAEAAKQDAEAAKQEAEAAKQENMLLESQLSQKNSLIAELQSQLAAINNKK